LRHRPQHRLGVGQPGPFHAELADSDSSGCGRHEGGPLSGSRNGPLSGDLQV
jgi:hypothetical protein